MEELRGALRVCGDWASILSAPQTGETILGWNGWRQHVVAWDLRLDGWVDGFERTKVRGLTHWTPLPAPPSAPIGERV